MLGWSPVSSSKPKKACQPTNPASRGVRRDSVMLGSRAVANCPEARLAVAELDAIAGNSDRQTCGRGRASKLTRRWAAQRGMQQVWDSRGLPPGAVLFLRSGERFFTPFSIIRPLPKTHPGSGPNIAVPSPPPGPSLEGPYFPQGSGRAPGPSARPYADSYQPVWVNGTPRGEACKVTGQAWMTAAHVVWSAVNAKNFGALRVAGALEVVAAACPTGWNSWPDEENIANDFSFLIVADSDLNAEFPWWRLGAAPTSLPAEVGVYSRRSKGTIGHYRGRCGTLSPSVIDAVEADSVLFRLDRTCDLSIVSGEPLPDDDLPLSRGWSGAPITPYPAGLPNYRPLVYGAVAAVDESALSAWGHGFTQAGVAYWLPYLCNVWPGREDPVACG